MRTPTAGLIKNFNRGFRLDEGSLRKLADTLKAHAAKVKTEPYSVRFTVYRFDDSFYEAESADSVLNDENCKTRRIKRLIIRITAPGHNDATDKDNASLAYVDFDLQDTRPVRVQIRGEDRDWCYLLLQDIEVIIEKVTDSRLAAIAQHQVMQFFVISGFAIIVPIFVFSLLGWLPIHELFSLKKPSDPNFALSDAYRNLALQIRVTYVLFAAFLLILFFASLDIGKHVVRLLGSSVFYWGDQVTAYDRRRELTRNIFWVVIVGLVLAWIGGRVFAK